MNDREMVEFAARAAGLDKCGGWDERIKCLWNGEGWSFDPLNYNGDAFTLACNRNMHISHYPGARESRAIDGDSNEQFAEGWDECGGKEAATRRAITRAAAIIGKSMGDES